jgi:CHAT domain-containing protein
VLAACETGQGAVDYTEGVEGLARALRIAGARDVLMTLWPVDDADARDFMLAFYTHWLGAPTADPATALRATQLGYLKHPVPSTRAPAVWAPYVLVGP